MCRSMRLGADVNFRDLSSWDLVVGRKEAQEGAIMDLRKEEWKGVTYASPP
jgi:hypothetical protein